MQVTVTLRIIFVVFLFVLSTGLSSCEIDTTLSITGGNPPTFVMKGNGKLGSIRVRGPHKQREAEGEEASLYWVIQAKDNEARSVSSFGSLVYGKVPEGYVQVYPEKGETPPLIEGEIYNIRVSTINANGDDGFFVIRKGKVFYSRIASELPEK